MKSLYKITLIFAGLITLTAQSVEVVIKTEEKQEEKKKEEPKGPDLPKPAQLTINAINMTENFDFVIDVTAQIKDQNYGFIFAQGIANKGLSSSFASLSGPEGASFEYVESQVTMKGSTDVKITCAVRSKEPEVDPGTEAKKSIDFFLYLAPQQTVPSCAIYFDSF